MASLGCSSQSLRQSAIALIQTGAEPFASDKPGIEVVTTASNLERRRKYRAPRLGLCCFRFFAGHNSVSLDVASLGQPNLTQGVEVRWKNVVKIDPSPAKELMDTSMICAPACGAPAILCGPPHCVSVPPTVRMIVLGGGISLDGERARRTGLFLPVRMLSRCSDSSSWRSLSSRVGQKSCRSSASARRSPIRKPLRPIWRRRGVYVEDHWGHLASDLNKSEHPSQIPPEMVAIS
jgi:hypothetical protein